MAILRSQRTYPLSLKPTTTYGLNVGIVAAYDYAGNPANSYAGGNGAPHVGNLTLGHSGSPIVVSLNNGEILARDPSQGKTVITPYNDLSVGKLGFATADGKGSFTIHRRYRAPSAYSGTSSNRAIAIYRDNQSRVSLYMVESIANPWCYFFVEMGSTTASMPPAGTRDSASSLRIPYGSIVDLHIVRDGDSARFYLNGVLVSTISIPAFLLYSTNWTGLATSDGLDAGNPNDLLLIDHVIWNRALSDTEVAQHKSDPYAGYVNSASVPDGLTVISPPSNATVNNEGFTISGTYQGGSPTSIQARFNNGSWITIANNPTGGAYSGQMPAVARGTGPIDVRYGNNTSVMATVTNITANPPAPTISVTNSPILPNGQEVTINTSFQRADSVTYNLVAKAGGAVSQSATVAVTYSTAAAAGTKTFNGVAPGDYTVNVVAIGPVTQTSANGSDFSILGVSGGGRVETESSSAAVPGAPTNVTATATETGALVLFNPPDSDGGSPITNYLFTASTGQVANVLSSPAEFILPKGIPVSFTGKAVNNIGPGPASAASNTVTPASVPGAPTSVVATLGADGISVSFAAPADNGGYPITIFMVESSSGQMKEGTTSPIVLPKPADSTVTYTVKAANQLGYGAASAPSNSVTVRTLFARVELGRGGNPLSNLLGLSWAWFDQATPNDFGTPTDKGALGTTDALGWLKVNLPNTTKKAGEVGWLIVTDSDGTVEMKHKAFSGPVAVE